jgi:hypothetical protein
MFMTKHERETMTARVDLEISEPTPSGGHIKFTASVPDVTALSTEDLAFVLEMTEQVLTQAGVSSRLVALDLEPAQQYEPAHARETP